MLKIHNPDTVAAPSSDYAHGIEAPHTHRRLYISGQVGETLDGKLAGDTKAQMEVCWQRISNILESADMDKTDLVKITVFLTDVKDTPLFRTVRDEFLEGHLTASSLLVVAGLANPDWTVEIEAIAEAKQ